MASFLTKRPTSSTIFTINNFSYVQLRYLKRLLHCSSTFLSPISKLSVQESFMLLGLKEDEASESEVRSAYFKLAKQFHPDSGKTTADADKFATIDNAYRVVLDHLSKKLGIEVEVESAEDKFDIRHTAPQHRQYLEYGGLGSGTPSMREKHFRQHRFEKAIEDIHSHKTTKLGSDETSIALPEKKAIRKTMISGAIERMVEDLIQEAMSKGELQNLPGSGQPIKSDPQKDQYIDSGTHRLNKVLIDSGYIPDWIMLEKEIREDTEALRISIRLKRSKLGPSPFTKQDFIKWEDFCKEFKVKAKLIDGKIDKLNLIVPILTRQKIHVNLEKEIMKVLNDYGFCESSGYSNEDLENPNKGEYGKEYEEFEKNLKLFFNKYFMSIFKLSAYYGNKVLQIFRVKYVNKN